MRFLRRQHELERNIVSYIGTNNLGKTRVKHSNPRPIVHLVIQQYFSIWPSRLVLADEIAGSVQSAHCET